MSLLDEYRRQFAWRDWHTVLSALPALSGARVLDLGCGPGDVAALLVGQGAEVVGVDFNEELLKAARERGLERAIFRFGDLRALPMPEALAGFVDGIWSSFALAYFTNPEPVVAHWAHHLRPGGWMALVEIDDLFGHHPLHPRTEELLAAHASDALAKGRYDFRMGRRLGTVLERCGLVVESAGSLADCELSFTGAASEDVHQAWSARLDRMGFLRARCGADWNELRCDLLGCLGSQGHRSSARVRWCVATRRT